MRMALPWPLPAALTWLGAWALAIALQAAQAPVWAVWGLPMALGAALACWPAVAATPWRRLMVAGGFPLSLLALVPTAAVPAWLWLLPLAVLALAYPWRAWRDAPVFPTPRTALQDLARHVPLAPGASVHDAGSGLGDGLLALHDAYPQARLSGIEWSWLWWAVARLRCPWATVRRGDMWAASWAAHDLVYLFQRPETMPRALAKARAEMRPDAWLVSLAFEGRDEAGRAWRPHVMLNPDSTRPVWVYRVGDPRGG